MLRERERERGVDRQTDRPGYKSTVGDRSRERTEGSLFSSYYTEV